MMTDYVGLVIDSIKNISVQVDGLTDHDINRQMMVLGEGSLFDSFSILLLLVDLEETISEEVLQGHSLVEWFSTLEFNDDGKMTLEQFTTQLFTDYLKA
jgi:hypothetical protein